MDHSRLLVSLFAALTAVAASAALAADWPEFAGHDDRNMVSPETGLPDTVNPGKKGAALHLKWTVKLSTKAYGTPVVANGRIFVGTNNNNPRLPQYTGDRGVLLCLDEKDGHLLWEFSTPRNGALKNFDHLGLGLCSSPYVDGDRLYLMTTRCELVCLTTAGLGGGNIGPFKDEAKYYSGADFAKGGGKTFELTKTDADIVWLYDLVKELKVSPHDSTDCSPLVHGDIVFTSSNNGVNQGHKVSDAPDAPTLCAFNKNTGALVATDDCHMSRKVFHGHWSNPTLARINGKDAVLYGSGEGILYAFDAEPVASAEPGKAGLLQKLWSSDANPPEHRAKDYHNREGPSDVIGTPAIFKDRIYLTVGQDPNHGDGIGNLSCFDLNTGKVLWHDPTIHRSLCTCSIAEIGGQTLLFVGDFGGYVYCYDAITGKQYWVHNTESAIWGSTLVADGKVYVGNTRGELLVFAASKDKKILSTNAFGSPIQNSPVAANGVLYVMTHTDLFAFTNQ